MWQYNFDYLCHSDDYLMHLHRQRKDHKYIDKYEKNGKTVYVYETPMQKAGRRAEYNINHPISSAVSGTKLWYPGQQNELRKNNPANSGRSGVNARTAMKSQNTRQNEINKSTSAASTYAKSQLANQAQAARQNEIKKAAKNYAAENAQNARQNAINKSKNSSPVAPKQSLSVDKQIQVNKAVAKSIDYINKTYGTNLGPEAAIAAEKERVAQAVRDSSERAAKARNAREKAVAGSVSATSMNKQLANAKKQEDERRRASNTAERSQGARDRAIAKSSQPFDAKKNQHMDALAERAFQKIRSKNVDFDIPNAYINDKGETAYFTAEERREIALKMFEKFLDDDKTSVSEVRRAKKYIMENFGVSEYLLDTLNKNHD